MTPIQTKVRELREICAQFNIHTLCVLERILYIGDDPTQEELAGKTGQQRHGMGQWESWMELNGVLRITSEPGKKRRHISYTDEGSKLVSKLEKLLLCPAT